MYLIKTLFDAFKQLIAWVMQFMIAFWDWLDIGDFLQNKLVFWIILFVFSVFGTYVSAKNKRKLWVGICSASDVITIIGAVISSRVSK